MGTMKNSGKMHKFWGGGGNIQKMREKSSDPIIEIDLDTSGGGNKAHRECGTRVSICQKRQVYVNLDTWALISKFAYAFQKQRSLPNHFSSVLLIS